MHTPRVLLLHSEVRSYRVPLFQLLHEHYPTRFFFLYGGGWASQFSESQQWNYEDLKPSKFLGYGSDVSWQLPIKLWKERHAFDVIIASGLSSFGTHASFLMAKILRKKFIVWAEDWVWSKKIVFRLARPYVQLIVRRADACIAASSKARELFLQFGANPKKVFIAPNCAQDYSKTLIDSGALDRLHRQFNPANKLMISYLGRVVEYKNLDALIRAFSQLEQERHNVLLFIAGDGPFVPFCRQLVKDLHVQNVVWPEASKNHQTGVVEPVAPDLLLHYLAMSDIFVLPGKFVWNENVSCEAWGMTLNEAMSLGKPVISTTSVGAAFDLIIDGETGYRVEENDPTALLKALRELCNNRNRIKQFGQAAQQLIRERWTYSHMIKGFELAITSALSR